VLWTHPQQQKGQLSDNKELESFENQSSLWVSLLCTHCW
jgi:hypothetical protein